jgi:hypothetical protein
LSSSSSSSFNLKNEKILIDKKKKYHLPTRQSTAPQARQEIGDLQLTHPDSRRCGAVEVRCLMVAAAFVVDV